MAKRKKHILDAGVCRDIVRELIEEQGPLTVSQLHFQIRKVFRVNSAYMVTTLTSRDGGFIIDNGLVDIEFIRPVRSVGRKGKKPYW